MTIYEGSACLEKLDGVFFSSLQRMQRDITIEVIKLYAEERLDKTRGIHICDALAGCGVRSIRYAFESKSITPKLISATQSKFLSQFPDYLSLSLSQSSREDNCK